jgi:peptidoglycan/xylan/chitin deacetylase (PgdA/CDA1 family)
MFHHFYNDKPNGQGAINSADFESIITYYLKHNMKILDPLVWIDKSKKNLLNDNEVVITFDDNLNCQYKVALPILNKYKIKAFWFIYSSSLEKIGDKLELYRQFRNNDFQDIEDFYQQFFNTIFKTQYAESVGSGLLNFNPQNYLIDFPFYTDNDRKFRYIRDKLLGSNSYCQIIETMMESFKVNRESLAKDLWISADDLIKLANDDHVIGLHSHSHPTDMANLSPIDQLIEYQTNQIKLTELVQVVPIAMSHPCNSYNSETLKILKRLQVKVGFRANMAKVNYSNLEYPREDHANIMRKIKLENNSIH